MKYMIFSTDKNENEEYKYATKYSNLENIDLTTGQLVHLKEVKNQWWDLLVQYMNDELNNIGHPFFRNKDFPQYQGVTKNIPSVIEFITSMIDFPDSFMNSYFNDIKKDLIKDSEIVNKKKLEKISELITNAILTQQMNIDIVNAIKTIEIDDLKITGISIIKRGDINGDGIVDMEDLTLMQKIVAGWKINYNEQVADINGDGIVDIEDLNLIKKIIAGWKVQTAGDIEYSSCRDLTISSKEYFFNFENELKNINNIFKDYRFTFLSDFVERIINKNFEYTDKARKSLIGGLYEVLWYAFQTNNYDYLNENFSTLFTLLNIDINEIINMDLSQEIVIAKKDIITNFVGILVDYCFPQSNNIYVPNTNNDCIEMVTEVENYFISGKINPDEDDEKPENYREKCKDLTLSLNDADQPFSDFENSWAGYIKKKYPTMDKTTIEVETKYNGLTNVLNKLKSSSKYNTNFSETDIDNLKRALSSVYFYYYFENDDFSWNHSAFDLFYSLLNLTPAEITQPSTISSSLSWNKSVDILIKNILNGFDYSLIKYDKKATVEIKPDVFFKLSDILNGDAGNSFDEKGEWVRSWKNSDEQTYKEVRNNDVRMPAITNSEDLDFTKDSSWDELGIRLLMPQYNRNVEIEDLDRNFWVIGQTLTGLMAFLFGENSPFKIVFQGIIKEIVELWENILYLWLGFAMTLSDKISYEKIHEEIIYLPLSAFQNEVKYDNFDLNSYSTQSEFEAEIWQQTGDTIIDKIKNYLNTLNGETKLVEWITPKINYLISKYSDSHLGILPVIRLNNYENNQYEAEFYPGFFTYDRNDNSPAWHFWSFKTPTGEQFVSANLNYEYSNLSGSLSDRQINKSIGVVGKSYLNRKSLYYFTPASDIAAANEISYDYLTDNDNHPYTDFFITDDSNKKCLFYGAKNTSITYYTIIRPIFNKIVSEGIVEPFCVYDSNGLHFNKMSLNLCDISKIACNSNEISSSLINSATFIKLSWSYQNEYEEGVTNNNNISGTIIKNNSYNNNLIPLITEVIEDNSPSRDGCWWLTPAAETITQTAIRITPKEILNQKNGFYMGEILSSFIGFFNMEEN